MKSRLFLRSGQLKPEKSANFRRTAREHSPPLAVAGARLAILAGSAQWTYRQKGHRHV